MKNKSSTKKNPPRSKSSRNKPRVPLEQDPFFTRDSKRRRRADEEIESNESDQDGVSPGEEEEEEEHGGGRSEFAAETADLERHRVAKMFLDNFREQTKRALEEEDETDEDEDANNRDSLVAEMLLKEQLEESGRARKLIASRVQKPDKLDGFQALVRHRQSVTAVALADGDQKGFSASKDGSIIQWDIHNGKSEKYVWPDRERMISHGAKNPQNPLKTWSKHVLALAISFDGRYLATGGLDRHVHLWDTRTRQHLQAFSGHRGPVSCLTFRQGSLELISASFDRTIKLWNVEDRAYMDSLFGHQAEILSIDCLRKERLLTVGRDRTMRLWKVPEESQLVFRAPATSLECCCFVSNDEFLSGSDDGSIELWSMLRKKPTFIVRNAHATMAPIGDLDAKDNCVPNGHIQENGNLEGQSYGPAAVSWVSSVAVSRNSDLAASGAGNGVVRLWAVESDTKSIKPLHDLPLVGFVNALAFAKSGRFLVAGVAQEPRLGRWARNPASCNGIYVQPLRISEE